MRISIFTEDEYGPAFVRRLVPLLEKSNLIPKDTTITDARKYPLYNPKLGSMVRASLEIADKSVVLIDADGDNLEVVLARTLNHIRKEDRPNVSVVALDYEIEEWICCSKSYKLGGESPSSLLEIHELYQKYRLPDYAEGLDFARLSRACESFKRFIAAISGQSN